MDLNFDVQTYDGLKEYVKQFSLDNKVPLFKIQLAVNAITRDTRREEIINKKFKSEFVSSFYVMDSDKEWSTDRIKKYVKIVSASSSNPRKLTALCFYNKPYYWFVEVNYDGVGYFEFDGIWLEEISYDDLSNNSVVEISEEKYNEALDNFIKELKTINWKYNHNRSSNKIPSDPDW